MATEKIVMTEIGMEKARIALRLYAHGLTPDEAFDILGFTEIDPEKYGNITKEQVMAVMMVTARECGAFD